MPCGRGYKALPSSSSCSDLLLSLLLFAALACLPKLMRLVITSNKPQAVDYTLALPALAGLRAMTRRAGRAAAPLHLELGVPDAAWGAALLRAVCGPGLARLMIAVREAVDSAAVAALVEVPGARGKLVGMDLEFRAAPTAEVSIGRLGPYQQCVAVLSLLSTAFLLAMHSSESLGLLQSVQMAASFHSSYWRMCRVMF